jgi:hypothetical protein
LPWLPDDLRRFPKVCKMGVDKQKERLTKGYRNLKDRYEDLLVEGDINRILNNDKDHLKDLNFIKEKEKIYTGMWIWVLAVFFIVILILYFIAR